MSDEKIKIIPCSGMGKVFGLIARESALQVVKKYPDDTKTVCLGYIIIANDNEDKKPIKYEKCITIDGCPAMCAAKNTEIAGGLIQKKIRVIDSFRNHKGAQPGTATELTDDGWQIVDEIVDEIISETKNMKVE